jgi:hypothetical protein
LTHLAGPAFNGSPGRWKETGVDEGDDPGPQPPKDLNLFLLYLLGGLFFLFVLLAGLIGLTP